MALDLGARDGILARTLQGRGGIETLIQSDLSLVNAAARGIGPTLGRRRGAAALRGAELRCGAEQSLAALGQRPAGRARADPPRAEARRPVPRRLFGAGTLRELRTSLIEAELAETGGASPRVSPFADLRDAAGLLQRAGFALPVADADTVTVTYGDLFALLRDLRGMGETNILFDRLKRPTRRTVFARAAAIYQERFADAQGRLPATFQILFLTGWAPDPSQQQPANAAAARPA